MNRQSVPGVSPIRKYTFDQEGREEFGGFRDRDKEQSGTPTSKYPELKTLNAFKVFKAVDNVVNSQARQPMENKEPSYSYPSTSMGTPTNRNISGPAYTVNASKYRLDDNNNDNQTELPSQNHSNFNNNNNNNNNNYNNSNDSVQHRSGGGIEQVIQTKEREIAYLHKKLQEYEEFYLLSEQNLKEQIQELKKSHVLQQVENENRLRQQKKEFNDKLLLLQKEHQGELSELKAQHEKQLQKVNEWCQQQIHSIEQNRDAILESVAKQRNDETNQIEYKLKEVQIEYDQKVSTLEDLLHEESLKLAKAREHIATLENSNHKDLVLLKQKLETFYSELATRDMQHSQTVKRLQSEMDMNKQKYEAEISAKKLQHKSEMSTHLAPLYRAEKLIEELQQANASLIEQIAALKSSLETTQKQLVHHKSETKHIYEKNSKLESESSISKQELKLLENENRRLAGEAEEYNKELSRLDAIVYGKGKRNRTPLTHQQKKS